MPGKAVGKAIGDGIAQKNRRAADKAEAGGRNKIAAPEFFHEQREGDRDQKFPGDDVIRRSRNHPAAGVFPPVDAPRHFFVVRDVDGAEHADQEEAEGSKMFAQAQAEIPKLHRDNFPRERHPRRRAPEHRPAADGIIQCMREIHEPRIRREFGEPGGDPKNNEAQQQSIAVQKNKTEQHRVVQKIQGQTGAPVRPRRKGKQRHGNDVDDDGRDHDAQPLGFKRVERKAGKRFKSHHAPQSGKSPVQSHMKFFQARLAAGNVFWQLTFVTDDSNSLSAATPHKRRVRYSGRNPRRFEEKYKEHGGDDATIMKVLAAGKTPAGTHRPIMVAEILEVLAPQPGEIAVDGTLGFGGHAQEILAKILPGGRLIGLDADPVELPKTEARLRAAGFSAEVFSVHRSNFAGLPKVLAEEKIAGANLILADLGVSSMQLDDPARGFSVKNCGPLDMRMNPQRGQPVSALLEKISAEALAELFAENADEPHAVALARMLAGKKIATTMELAKTIRAALPEMGGENAELSVRRIFQALRIAVNDEFSALETFLRNLPLCLNPGGRAAVLTFHSGEDRRVKKAFAAGWRDGIYLEIAQEVIRPSEEERNANPRSTSAKLRWAKRAI